MAGVFRGLRHCSDARALASVVAIALLAAGGCDALYDTHTDPEEWQATVQRPDSVLNANASVDPNTGQLVGDPGYFLYLCTDAVGIQFDSAERFIRTLHKHPRGGKNDQSVGHSWLILDGPGRMIERGHTGEFGVTQPTYYSGVWKRVANDDPNPIAYLWQDMNDGELQCGPGMHAPTFVLRIPLTREQHHAIDEYINDYDYRRFALLRHACSDFVAGAAELAGVNVTHRIRLRFPAEGTVHGHHIRVWTDPKYSELSIGSPDVLEKSLQRLAEQGIGEDATEWYLD